MKRLLIILIVLLASVWLGAVIAIDPGYVLIVYRQWTIEAPLWIAAILLLTLFGMLYGLLRLWRNLRRLPHRLRVKSLMRKNFNSQRLTKQGLLLVTAGKMVAAEKKLIQGAASNSTPWLNYLVAAYAANIRQDLVKRDNYLQRANEVAPEAQVAIGLAQVYFYLQNQQWDQALALLNYLYSLAPQQILILQGLARVYVQFNDWKSLLKLLVLIRKYNIFTPEKINDLEVQAYKGLLIETAQENNGTKLLQVWNQVPHAMQGMPEIAKACVKALTTMGNDAEAEKILNKILSKTWDQDLICIYGLLKSAKPELQLNIAENWLKAKPNDAVLLLALGRLAVKNQLWGKAKSYFEASLSFAPQPEAYQALGKLLDQLGETAAAKDCYIKGLELAIELNKIAA